MLTCLGLLYCSSLTKRREEGKEGGGRGRGEGGRGGGGGGEEGEEEEGEEEEQEEDEGEEEEGEGEGEEEEEEVKKKKVSKEIEKICRIEMKLKTQHIKICEIQLNKFQEENKKIYTTKYLN